jgi:hypothetical protein
MFTCEFCNKTFKRESSIFKHMCKKKERYVNKNSKESQAGYLTYLYWYSRSYGKKVSAKTFDDFIENSSYDSFSNFGKYIIDSKIKEWEKYIDWLIKTKTPIQRWAKDSTYYEFYKEIIRTESVSRALERYILFLQDWEDTHNIKWNMFWNTENPFAIVNYIKEGKISPWILFSSNDATDFVDRLPDELILEIDKHIDLSYWNKKISKRKEDLEWAKNLLK